MNNTFKTPVGLSIPLQRGNNGYFQQNFNTLDQAQDNIKNLLLTMTGERRMNVSFGSSIYGLLFEQIQNEEEMVGSIQNTITNLLNLYFPYVDIKNIDINVPDYNQNQIDISLTFQLKNSSNIQFGVADTRTINMTFNTI